ncbi:MAG: J domain-containing protein [Spirochaetota bacterium]
MDRPELYRTLGVHSGASIEELKEAYKRLVKQFHPDLTHNQKSAEQFARVVNAYKVLTVSNRSKTLIDFPLKNVQNPGKAQAANTPTNIFVLGKLLTGGKTVPMRAFAARSLGNSGKKSAYAFLRKALYDQDQIVVKSAIDAIGNLRIFQSAGELSAVFVRGNKELKTSVLRVIGKISTEGAFRNILLMGMQDAEPEIRLLSLKLFSSARKENGR